MRTPGQGQHGLWDLYANSENRGDVGRRWQRPGLGDPACFDTYHRTWLVQAWRSRLTLLALHSFPARDATFPLNEKGDEGMAMVAMPRLPPTPLRDALGACSHPALLPASRPPPAHPASLPASCLPCPFCLSLPLFSPPAPSPPRLPHLFSTFAPVAFLSSRSGETLTKGLKVKPENKVWVCSCYLSICPFYLCSLPLAQACSAPFFLPINLVLPHLALHVVACLSLWKYKY